MFAFSIASVWLRTRSFFNGLIGTEQWGVEQTGRVAPGGTSEGAALLEKMVKFR